MIVTQSLLRWNDLGSRVKVYVNTCTALVGDLSVTQRFRSVPIIFLTLAYFILIDFASFVKRTPWKNTLHPHLSFKIGFSRVNKTMMQRSVSRCHATFFTRSVTNPNRELWEVNCHLCLALFGRPINLSNALNNVMYKGQHWVNIVITQCTVFNTSNQFDAWLIIDFFLSGRALRLQTSDGDRKKLSTLAGLAVQAGFDWVHYATSSYIHASVIRDGKLHCIMNLQTLESEKARAFALVVDFPFD